jgi:outer membrane scaffolding protein for murein synthesis (MipA/OmpV family)
MYAKALTLTATLAVALPTLAQPAREPLLLGGAGVGVQRSPYRGVDAKTRLLPLIVYENAWVSVALPSVDVKLTEAGPVALRLRARYGFDGYKASDSDFLAGMERRKGSLWLGPAAIWDTGLGELSFQWLGDTLGNSKGSQWELQYDKRLDFGALALTPRVAVQGVDRKYVDYYYGVRASEATAARPAYVGQSGRQVEVGLRMSYRLDERQTLFADLSGTRLGTAIEKSPLLERRYSAGAFAGWLYRF